MPGRHRCLEAAGGRIKPDLSSVSVASLRRQVIHQKNLAINSETAKFKKSADFSFCNRESLCTLDFIPPLEYAENISRTGKFFGDVRWTVKFFQKRHDGSDPWFLKVVHHLQGDA